MSTFDHSDLIQDINDSLVPFRMAQADALAGFGAQAKAAITGGVLSAKQKELIALAIGVTQRCSGCIGFHVKALHRLQCTRAELEEMQAVCVHGWRPRADVRGGSHHGLGEAAPQDLKRSPVS